jgi:hypothetical protein
MGTVLVEVGAFAGRPGRGTCAEPSIEPILRLWEFFITGGNYVTPIDQKVVREIVIPPGWKT